MENFHVKTQISTDFAHTFSKNYSFFCCFFLITIILSTLQIYLFGPKIAFKAFFTTKDAKKFRKNQFFSIIFTFLSITLQNFEDKLRILANFGKFSCKNSKSMDFAYTFSNLHFLYFLIKIILFCTKNLFIRPKNCVQSILYNERCKEFRKNQFFSNIFTFLSVTCQNFEDSLRILPILGNFHVKTQNSTYFAHTFSKN